MAEATNNEVMEEKDRAPDGTQANDTEQPSDSGSVEEVKNAVFSGLTPDPEASEKNNLGLLLDVTVPITVELGRSNLKIQEILSLSPGSVIELDKLADESVDLMVNGKLMARGEIVVVDNYFGLRVREIVDEEKITSREPV